MKMLIKDLAVKLNVDKSTAFKAIKKMDDVSITKIKVAGIGSLVSAIDEKDIKKVEDHFGINTKTIK